MAHEKPEYEKLIESFGVMNDSTEAAGPGTFAVDFNNEILGSPYITGTGYLPDRETAEAVANIILPLLDALAHDEVDRDPQAWQDHWTNGAHEHCDSYATLVSWDRKAWGDDPRGGDPVVEESYYGDVWFVVSAEMGMVSVEQRAMVDKLNAAIRSRRVGA